jgi:hypothetical protein
MKMLTLLITLAFLCSGSLAFGINDDGENSLGVYFDPGTFEQNCIDVPVGAPFSMYFVLANCTQPSIGGYEFAWDFDPDLGPDLFELAPILPPLAVRIPAGPREYIVGLGAPLVTGPATQLVEIPFLAFAPGIEANITVGPVEIPSIPGQTAFVDGFDPAILIPMTYSTLGDPGVFIDPEGFVRPGIGTLSCPGPVAVEQSSWGSVKALYQ